MEPFAMLRFARSSSAIRRSAAARTALTRSLTTSTGPLPVAGQVIHGFTVQRTTAVPELHIDVAELSHNTTGAKFTHFARDDANNAFAVGFRTPVNDSTGVPHILEHTTLCGSKKYPVRDPFFKMLQRSLSTFMNAMTYQDLTLYPFSTMNNTDYRNLMSVYLDAVFQPNLRRLDFSQEGWRLEHKNVHDPTSPIEFKGVVYNEMKGAMSGIHYHFAMALNRHLFPGSIYAPNSGGDPKHITDLSWEQLVEFHRKHYAPANAHFFSYGNFNLAETLAYVNKTLESLPEERKTMTGPVTGVKDLPTLSQPKAVHETAMFDPMGDPDKQARFCLAWGCNDTSADVYTNTALSILSKLLLDGSSSPMQQALIDSGLAPDYSPAIGYDPSTRRASFAIGVQGISASQIPQVEETIWSVLRTVAETGFPKERVDAVIHQMELGMRHVTASFGMNLLQNMAPSVFHGSDIADSVAVTKHLARLHDEAVNKNLFQDLLKQYLLNNQHRISLTMTPDAEFPAQVAAEETARLQRHVAKLTEQDKQRIHEEGLELVKAQETKQDISVLPCLTLNEVPKETPVHPVERIHSPWTAAGAAHLSREPKPEDWEQVTVRKAPTNGIAYLAAVADLKGLDPALHPYLPLFASSLTWQGTHDKTMEELDQELRLYTGGVGMSPRTASSLDHKGEQLLQLSVGGNALTKNVSHLTRLMSQLTFQTKFDRLDRLQNLIAGNVTSMANGIAHRGHSLAMALAASKLMPSFATSESWSGLSQLQFLSGLQAGKIEDVVPKLEAILDHVKRSQTKYMVVAEDEHISAALSHLSDVASNFKPNPASAHPSSWTAQSNSLVFVPAPFPVNYCALAIPTVPYVSAHESMALTLAGNLATHQFLHREIREKGGAYGGGATHNAREGAFLMYSYRDPRQLETMRDFERAIDWLAQGMISDQDLLEAKLGIFGSMDAPVDVGSQGSTEFVHGITKEMRQERRDALFAVTVQDIVNVTQKYLVARMQGNGRAETSRVILGNAEKTKELEQQGWEVMPLQM